MSVALRMVLFSMYQFRLTSLEEYFSVMIPLVPVCRNSRNRPVALFFRKYQRW
ncbi:hypothetical protein ACIBKY_27595 [Nonomuraea sp. NPDC050394]|uniref:hypothetical protein n=1 Tax=Nonomuraea sp. NPDC050394 TaxID=3364363 RepID=UPI003799D0AB